MNGDVERWLEGMRDARDPGPAIRIAIRRKGQPDGCMDLTLQTDLADLAERILEIVEVGVPPRCNLRALDLADNTIGSLRVGPSSRRARKTGSDDLVLAAIVESRRLTAALAAGLQTENAALREEGRDLRLLLTLVELWRSERNQET
jgi:hypothetical protein